MPLQTSSSTSNDGLGHGGVAVPAPATARQELTEATRQAAAAKLLQMFHSGQFPEIAKRSILLKSYGNSPCNKWSIGNIITILLAGPPDARGFRQWEEVGRTVKKGAVVIECAPFRTLTATESHVFHAAAARYGEFLEMPVVYNS